MKKEIFRDILEEYKALSKLKDFSLIARYLVIRENLYDTLKEINARISISKEEDFKDKEETFFDLIIQYFGARIGIILKFKDEKLEDIIKEINNLRIRNKDLEAIILVRVKGKKSFEGVMFDSLIGSDFKIKEIEWHPLERIIQRHFGIQEIKKIPVYTPIQLEYDKGYNEEFKTIFTTLCENFVAKSGLEKSMMEKFERLMNEKTIEVQQLIDKMFLNEEPKKIFEKILEFYEIEGSDLA